MPYFVYIYATFCVFLNSYVIIILVLTLCLTGGHERELNSDSTLQGPAA